MSMDTENNTTASPYLSRADVARMLHLSEDSVSELIREGRLRATKLCRRWVITAEAVREMVVKA